MALPAIGEDLGAGPAAMQWTIAGYGLAFALLLVTGGRLGDNLGRRKVLLFGLVGFASTSALAGLAASASVLVAARAAQGGFAALMIPQVLATIAATMPESVKQRAFGLFGAVAGLSAVAGPLLGGVILEVASIGWRAIFLLNVPAAALVFVATRRWVTESRSPRPAPLDFSGVALLSAALALALVSLIEGPERGWPIELIGALAIAGPVLGVFAVHQARLDRKGRSPLVPPSLFRRRQFVAGGAAALLIFSVPPSLMFVTTNALQAMGHTPLTTAFAFVPLALASVPAAMASGTLVERFGRRVPISGALLILLGTAEALVAVTTAGAALSGRHLLPGLVTAGVGLGLVAPTLIGFVLSDVEESEAGSASGVLNTGRSAVRWASPWSASSISVHSRTPRLLPKHWPMASATSWSSSPSAPLRCVGSQRLRQLPDGVLEAVTLHMTQFPPVEVTLPWMVRDGKPTTVSLLLTTRERKALNRNYFNTHLWRPALERCGIPDEREIGCQALRHFFASTALHEGETIMAVSEYLGHADPGFTLRTYTHLMQGSSERTKRAIDSVFKDHRR